MEVKLLLCESLITVEFPSTYYSQRGHLFGINLKIGLVAVVKFGLVLPDCCTEYGASAFNKQNYSLN